MGQVIPVSEEDRFRKLKEIADRIDEMGRDLIKSGVPYGYSLRQQALNILAVIE